jgi:hypothetical protein
LTELVHEVLIGLLIVGAAIWIGGMVTVFVLSRVAHRILPAAERVRLFRAFGRIFGMVTTAALVLAYGTGIALLWGRPWDGWLIAAVAVAAAVLVATAVGVVQARRMGRLRADALTHPNDERLVAGVRRAAVRAAGLRGLIALFSFVLLALGVVLGAPPQLSRG